MWHNALCMLYCVPHEEDFCKLVYGHEICRWGREDTITLDKEGVINLAREKT